ncbi:MAG: TonB-dependent receptor [Calditrichaceae bacterium]|nr:TonB-dependent receptor [Calditrichaceae bacterium]MBN2708213.1 TonB-dependent receptor [Calditrichaceae bacterium]RQV92237.1 MAG: TonB-dependent receptor [Calditrichota bacterium]
MRRIILYISIALMFIMNNESLLANEEITGVSNIINKTGTICGKVVDQSTDEPLIGVNIIILNTTLGASTDVRGEFTISHVPVGEVYLVASYIGYNSERRMLVIKNYEITVADFSLYPGIMETGTIVVTGTSTPYLYEDAPVKTEVIPRKLIDQSQACNLAEAMSFQTGVRVENNCQNCNFTQVRILGFDGKYSQLLIDGDPVISSVAGVYGLEHFPEEMIDQIEIVKGGGSALYGGDAIAGTINMITSKPLSNRMHLKYKGVSVDGEYDQEIGAISEIINNDGTSGAYVFLSSRKRNAYDRNEDGYSELGQLRNESLGFNWYYKPILQGELSLRFHHIHEERRGGNDMHLPVHEADIAEYIEHWRYGGSARWDHKLNRDFNYKAYYSFSIIDRQSYFGGLSGDTPEERLDALKLYGKTDNWLHVGGFQLNYQANRHYLSSGVQLTQDMLEDKTVANPAYYIDDIYQNFGVFLQDDFHFGAKDRFEIIAGVRADKHSEINDWILSPRLSAKIDLSEDYKLRASVSTGFKAPQTYDEDLHICGLEGDQRVIRNSSGLKPEKSVSVSAGVEYQKLTGTVPVMISLTGFYTRLENAFTDQFIYADGNVEFWERINSDGAMVHGVEADMGVRPLSNLEFRGGLTYNKSKYDSPIADFNTTNFLRTPDLYGYIRSSFDVSDIINLFTAVVYTGKMNVPHEISVTGQNEPKLVLKNVQDFYVINAGLTLRLPMLKSVSGAISIGIKNLTDAYQEDLDKNAERDPAYVYGPHIPRSIYLGLDMSF